MKNVLSGNGEAISVVPGQKLYFRVKSTSTSFSSEIQTLSVSGRPSAPMFAIDFVSETTSQNITRDYEFSYSQSMSNPITGNGTPLVLELGKDLYICQKANSYSFRSDIQHLAVPARPPAPINLRVDDDVNLFDWDFAMGFNKFSDYEYSIDNGSTWNLCSTKPLSVGNINVNPGALKLRVKATSTTFKGDLASSDKAFTIKTGIPSLADAGIGLHPNPGKDFLFLDNLPKNSVLMILNSNGTIMIQKKFENSQVAIPIGGWPGDLFIIQVTTSRGQYQSKFVKL